MKYITHRVSSITKSLVFYLPEIIVCICAKKQGFLDRIFIWNFNGVQPTSLFGGKDSAVLLQPKLKLLLPRSHEGKIFNIYLSLADHFRSWRRQHLPVTLWLCHTLACFLQPLQHVSSSLKLKICGNRSTHWGTFPVINRETMRPLWGR